MLATLVFFFSRINGTKTNRLNRGWNIDHEERNGALFSLPLELVRSTDRLCTNKGLQKAMNNFLSARPGKTQKQQDTHAVLITIHTNCNSQQQLINTQGYTVNAPNFGPHGKLDLIFQGL
jgi:hypothetical protein